MIEKLNTSFNKLAQKSKLTLIFDNLSPLISDSLRCLFCQFGIHLCNRQFWFTIYVIVGQSPSLLGIRLTGNMYLVKSDVDDLETMEYGWSEAMTTDRERKKNDRRDEGREYRYRVWSRIQFDQRMTKLCYPKMPLIHINIIPPPIIFFLNIYKNATEDLKYLQKCHRGS